MTNGVWGGQGRDPESVEADGIVAGITLGLAGCLAIAAAIAAIVVAVVR